MQTTFILCHQILVACLHEQEEDEFVSKKNINRSEKMEGFCNFCGQDKSNVGISECTFIYDNQTVIIIEDLLKIFRNDVVEMFAFDPTCSICSECLKQLRNSYIFVQKIKETAARLKTSSSKEEIKNKPQEMKDIDSSHVISLDTLPRIDFSSSECGTTGNNKESIRRGSIRRRVKTNKTKIALKPLLPKISGKNKNRKKSISCTYHSRLYKCLVCTQAYKSFKLLREHEAGNCHSANITGLSICQYCHLCFKEATTMTQHQNLQHPDQQFLCCLCTGKGFVSKGYLARHINSIHHHPFLQFFCGECEEILHLRSREEVKEHFSKVHPLEEVNDNSGNEKSQDEEDMDLEMHEEFLDEFLLAHTNENSFQFSECWEALDLHLPDMLQGHSTNFHSSERLSEAFPCPKCFEQFKNPQPLLKHLAENHNLPVLICRTCRKAFTSFDDFKIHKGNKCEKNPSADILSIPCPYCSKTFTSSLSLKQHLRIVHTHHKKHICQLCDKLFSTLDHLKKHVLSQHQNERKHSCPTCAKSFTQLCHLKQHVQIHTTGKTIECTECSVKFWRNIDMQRHRKKIHAGF